MPIPSVDDTIVAIATPHLGGHRGILRLTGERVERVVAPWIDQPFPESTVPSRHECSFHLPAPLGRVPVDIYYWPGSRTYTGQPTVELHTIGAIPVLEAMHAACCRTGARAADRGEFTMRAFLAGKLDLTQVEAVWQVIHAESDESLEAALRQLAGNLATPLQSLRRSLLSLLAELEAGLDFVDEEIEFVSPEEVARACREAEATMSRLLEQLDARTPTGDVPHVVFVGPANAGKSSLINALAGRPVAIVSPQAGTTRDAVTTTVQWDGRPVVLCDTAGTCEAPTDRIDAAAQIVATEAAAGADVAVRCLDATREEVGASLPSVGRRAPIAVWTKCDVARPTGGSVEAIETSSRTGMGLDALRQAILDRLSSAVPSGCVPATAARCRGELEAAIAAIGRAGELARKRASEDLLSVELRESLDHVGRLVGAVYTDDILDEIFGRFCIGK